MTSVLRYLTHHVAQYLQHCIYDISFEIPYSPCSTIFATLYYDISFEIPYPPCSTIFATLHLWHQFWDTWPLCSPILATLHLWHQFLNHYVAQYLQHCIYDTSFWTTMLPNICNIAFMTPVFEPPCSPIFATLHLWHQFLNHHVAQYLQHSLTLEQSNMEWGMSSISSQKHAFSVFNCYV